MTDIRDAKMNSVPIFEWETCLQYFGSRELAKEALIIFKKEANSYTQGLETAFSSNDKNKLNYISSSLTGAAAYCGLTKLYKFMYNTLPLIKEGSFKQIDLDNIKFEVKLSLSVISDFLQN